MAKKYEINVLTSNGLQQIIAERVFEPLYPSHWFMLHRPVGGERKWAITETQTGLMVTGGHKTKAEAINRLHELLEIKGIEKLEQAIERAIEEYGMANISFEEVKP